MSVTFLEAQMDLAWKVCLKKGKSTSHKLIEGKKEEEEEEIEI